MSASSSATPRPRSRPRWATARFGIKATYIRQQAPLGLAHAVLVARDFLGDDDFVMYLGDNFIVGGITGLVRGVPRAGPDAQIMLTRVSDPRGVRGGRAGRGHRPGDRARGEAEAAQERPGPGRRVHVHPAMHEAVASLKPSWRGELEITEAIQWLLDSGRAVNSTTISGTGRTPATSPTCSRSTGSCLSPWTPRQHGEVDDASARSSAGWWSRRAPPSPAPGSSVRSIIGAGAKVTGSYIGPFTAIDENCVGHRQRDRVLHRAEQRASISGVRRIEASLIGHDAEVTPAPRVPRAHRLVLGDHSKVQISS
jgi:glucose-1-phosphate thymidylyltransferase